MEFFDDDAGKRIGTASLQSPSIAAYEANAAEVLANTALATAFAGYAERLFENETYYVTFTNRAVQISSYQDDAIKDAVETWADAVGALE